MSVSDNPERFAAGSVMFARPQRLGVAKSKSGERLRLTVECIRGTDDFPIVAFQQVDSREAAEALRGYVLEVEGSQLPELEPDEFYPFDLVGLEVRTPDGSVVGTLADVVESPAHALLAVELMAAIVDGAGHSGATLSPDEVPKAAEVLVPFVSEAVPTVDLDSGFVEILPRFLFDAGEKEGG